MVLGVIGNFYSDVLILNFCVQVTLDHYTLIYRGSFASPPFSVSFSMGISTPMDIYRKFHYVKNTNKNINDLIRNFMDLNFFLKFFNRL